MGILNNAILATSALVAAVAAQNGTSSNSSSSAPLPIVDLGYEMYQARNHNTTGAYYNFTNIRYAAPPVGDLRFSAPQSPAVNRSAVNDGSRDNICAQANPAWIANAGTFIAKYLGGQTVFNASSFPASNGSAPAVPAQDPRTSEDCLSLDVVVPENIFATRDAGYGAPVLVWIYGGGYTAGSKGGSGNPAGLLARSENNGGKGVIYVAMNYRLGAFGWLSGPTFQNNGTANAGLYDQRFALEWVQKYIHLFGGDPSRVTVFGESAGGGSIMHQITAYGGNNGSAPFAQAVPQSPGFQPIVSAYQQEQTFDTFLSLLNVTTLEQARQQPFSAVQLANIKQVGAANYGEFVFGPVVDGDFAPALPGQLLAHGQYDKSLRLLIGHNADEGLLFTSPFNQNDSVVAQGITTALPGLNGLPQVLNYITNTLYPPTFDGSQAQGYKDQIGRAAAINSELIFTCNTFYLDKAYNNKTFSYYFTVPPALHGQDIAYTYYDGTGQVETSVPAPQIALALQEYITSFAMTGNPNEQGVPFFNMYGNNATVQVLGATGVSQMTDTVANERCNFWQKALYY